MLAVVPVVVLLQVLYPPVQRWRSPMGAQLADEAAAAPVLSTTEIEAFKADGVLILPGFIDEEQLASWRCQAWAAVGADPDDRTTWPTGLQPNLTVAPHLGELPQCQALMEQLGGGAFTGGGTMLKCIFPEAEEAHWRPAAGGHVDGYNQSWVGSGHHRCGITVYLDDVEEKGGCFTVWPGGHRRVHEFFRKNPQQIDGRFTVTESFKQRGWNCLHDDGGALEPPVGTQHAAQAGTACLWHGWCPHSASMNARDRPRLALIARWNDTRFGGPPVLFSNRAGASRDGAGKVDTAERVLKVLDHEGVHVERVTWDGVDAEMRRHRRYDVPVDLFRDWGPAVSGSGAARL